jgi:cysteine desulfurase/selenocysteine lyase
MTTALRAKDRMSKAYEAFDVERVRRDFPILRRKVNGKPLVYLDNAATSQKPDVVIEAVKRYYERENANVHRGVHYLSERATAGYEGCREKVRRFLNAAEAREIVFVRGTTEAINLVAQAYGRLNLQAGDEVVITAMEHHSNIVPWQIVCQEREAKLRVAPITDEGELDFEEYERLLSGRTKLVAAVHVSNALGTVNPVKDMIEAAHNRGIPVLLDGAQGAAHMPVDVQDLDCDFYTLSSHKMFGPTGIGALYGRAELLEAMGPYQGGGDMIRSVSFEKTVYAPIPAKYEAGTPNIAGVAGFGAAIDYIRSLDWDGVQTHEAGLLQYANERLTEVDGLRFVGSAERRAGVVSFTLDGVHAHDIGTVLDQEGIAVRAGHHCAQPVMDFFGVSATARASFALYNTKGEIDRLSAALDKVGQVFR